MYNLPPQPKQSHQHHHPLQKSHQTQLSFHHAGLPPHVILSHFHHPHMAIFAPARFCIYIYTRIALRAPRVAARARSSSSSLFSQFSPALYTVGARGSQSPDSRGTQRTHDRASDRDCILIRISFLFFSSERGDVYIRGSNVAERSMDLREDEGGVWSWGEGQIVSLVPIGFCGWFESDAQVSARLFVWLVMFLFHFGNWCNGLRGGSSGLTFLWYI